MGVSMAQPETTTPVREQWSGQYGFILAAIGSAVGLGNIWRFPGVAYENGGGAFLLPYVIALLTAGIPILLLDYSLGHRFRGAAPTVFRRLGRRFEPLGWFQVAISFVIATYYTVIVVWAIRYVGFSVDLAWGDDPGSFLVNDFLRASGPGFELDFVGGKHNEIHSSIPIVDNVGVVVDRGALYHPGDSYAVPAGVSIDVLAAPSSAPWLKIGEAMDFVLAVKPRRAFPMHELINSAAGQAMAKGRIAWAAEQNGGALLDLEAGTTAEL